MDSDLYAPIAFCHLSQSRRCYTEALWSRLSREYFPDFIKPSNISWRQHYQDIALHDYVLMVIVRPNGGVDYEAFPRHIRLRDAVHQLGVTGLISITYPNGEVETTRPSQVYNAQLGAIAEHKEPIIVVRY